MVSRHFPRPGVRSARLALLACLAILVISSSAWAQRPSAPKLLPDTTVAYVRVANARETVEKFKETATGKMFQDPQIAPLVGDLYGSAREAFTEVEQRIGITLDELLAIPQGELSAALVVPPMGRPQLAVLLEVNDQMQHVDKLLNRAFEEAGALGMDISISEHRGAEITSLASVGDRSRAMHLCTRDGVVLLSSDVAVLEQLLDAWDGQVDTPRLADNRRFTTIMASSVGTREERPQISWYADPIALVRAAGQGNVGAQVGLALLSPLGLDGLEGVGGSVILAAEEFDSIMHMHVLLQSPREGVLKMLALREGDTTPEPWVPQDVASYMTINWDFATTFGELARLFDLIRLQEGAFSDLVRQRISRRLGADFQQEILPALAGRVTMATRIQRPIRLNSESTIVGVQLKDGNAFRPIFQKVIDQLSANVEAQSYGSATYYKLPSNRPTPPNVDPQLVRQPQPAVMLLDDFILFSDNTELLEKCIATRGAAGRSLQQDEDFARVMERLSGHADRPPGMIGFSRPEENLRAMYELGTAQANRDRIAQAAGENRFFGALNKAMNQHPLPPFEVIAKYLPPSGAMMINDATGIHYITFGLRSE